ncbi:MAG: hypothetical protein C4523_17420 [Myxococcales bacterium]|nr:MAG: hypothetical protein C4523_17420 [Myxococcales bacterium]
MVQITNRFMISSEKFVRNRYGRASWDEAREEMTPATRADFDRKLDPKGLADFDKVADVLRAIEKTLGPRVANVLFELGLHNSEDDLSVTQKLVMRLISVEWVLRAAALLWGQRIKNGGRIEIRREGKGHVKATVFDFPEPVAEWWRYLSGWFTCAIRFSGGQDVRVVWEGGGDTPTSPTRFDAQWK